MRLATKLCYAVGGIPYQATNIALALSFQIFLLDVVQVRDVFLQTLALLSILSCWKRKAILRSLKMFPFSHNTATYYLTFCCQKDFSDQCFPKWLIWFCIYYLWTAAKSIYSTWRIQTWVCRLMQDLVLIVRELILFEDHVCAL